MQLPQKLANLRRNRDGKLQEAQRVVCQGRYLEGEEMLLPALELWRRDGGPKQEEAPLILLLGKCYEGQRKYVEAYELYMKALGYLTGEAYDDVYSQFLYLNEKMGAFDRKPQCGY
jgi:tetratricopeptide (TPR) repeat protein